MDAAAKSGPSAAHRARLAVTWLLFIVFVALLSFGIVVYAQTSTHVSGLAMAIIGILGIAALATSLKLARARALGNGRGIYNARAYGGGGGGYGGGMDQHQQWFHHHRMWEQRRRNDEYQQQQQQQHNFYAQQQQQQMWND